MYKEKKVNNFFVINLFMSNMCHNIQIKLRYKTFRRVEYVR